MSQGIASFARSLLRPLKRLWSNQIEQKKQRRRQEAVGAWIRKNWLHDERFLQSWEALGRGDYHRVLEIAASAPDASWTPYFKGSVDSVFVPVFRQNQQVRAEKYLVVKEWACGFWADVDHVIGQLLIAEWTNRIPVVVWGRASLYHPGGDLENCFPLFFQLPTATPLSALSQPNLSYFPPVFDAGNLLRQQADQFSRPGSLDKGFSVLARPEQVLVSDRHVGIEVLWDYWTSLAMFPTDEVAATVRMLFSRYLVPSAEVQRRVEAFWSKMPVAGLRVAAHVRGGDRTESFEKLDENNAAYFERIDVLLDQDQHASVLLLTDSTYIVDRFVERYGTRVFVTEAQRSSNKSGVHYDPNANRAELGYETLVDVLLALRCDQFLGCMSNVSRFVDLLKDWNGASYRFPNIPSNIL